jgi:hypothetical protein
LAAMANRRKDDQQGERQKVSDSGVMDEGAT